MLCTRLLTLASAILLSVPLFAQTQALQGGGPQVAARVPERLDLDMYARIRDEGLNHSHVMDYAGALFDDIGPRLTGSPAMKRANDWTRDQLAAMGCSNAHLESWGEFGLAWTQLDATLALVKPSPGVFLAQATPWSPATQGPVTAEVIEVPGLSEESEFAAWKGKLKGKVILYGQSGYGSPAVDPNAVPEMEHYDAAKLQQIAKYPLTGEGPKSVLQIADPLFKIYMQRNEFQRKVSEFFAAEGAIAVLEPGGSGGILHDDTNASMGWLVYRPDHRQAVPEEVIADEAWDRMDRLLSHKVPVVVRINVATQVDDEHVQGYNTIAEIPGTDPQLKDEVVMVGGHLDSWIAGTGATDNGAGSIVAMEAMRILNTLHVRPRRTIRIALWSGEEQGLLGSMGYVTNHFATFHYPTGKDDDLVPNFLLQMTQPPTIKPEAARLDAYYNMDSGAGELLGIYTEGNQGASDIFRSG